jgi:HTH-type transcriptional regulator/antitoxin HigA
MPVIDRFDEKKYGRLLAKHLPQVIDNDAEQDRLAEVLLHLTVPERELSPEESKLADLIGRLVEDYENQTRVNKLRRFTPLETLQHLIEDLNLKQADLVDVFGTQSIVSDVLAGRRRINQTHARRLAERFRMSIDVFL